MHPIFRKKSWLAVYLVLWLAVLDSMLAALMHVAGTLSWSEAQLVAWPLCLLYAFLFLTPWYTCRQFPLVGSNRWSMAISHLSGAVLATSLWVALARLMGWALSLGNRLDPVIPYVVVVGMMCYALSVALHYMMLAMEASRQAVLDAREAGLRALKARRSPWRMRPGRKRRGTCISTCSDRFGRATIFWAPIWIWRTGSCI